MDFCTKEQYQAFAENCPKFESHITAAGILLIKFWLEVGQEEQQRRFEARIEDPLRQWKLSPMDLESYARWYAYSRARDMMLDATDTDDAPWHIVRSDDKRRAAELHLAPAQPDPLRGSAPGEGEAAQAIDQRGVRRSVGPQGPDVRAGELTGAERARRERSCQAARRWASSGRSSSGPPWPLKSWGPRSSWRG
jgi:hypothetical protein